MSTILAYSANDIITDAFLDSGIIPPDQVPQPEDIATGFRILNRLLKLWQVDMHLWKQEEGVLFLNKGQSSYFLGPTGGEACKFDDFILTTTTEDLVALDTIITVETTEGMSGPQNSITKNPIDATLWTPTNGTVTVVSGELVITNDAGAFPCFADYEIFCTKGNTYKILADFVLGTSIAAELAIVDPTTDTNIIVSGGLSSSQLVTLEFVATQPTMVVRFNNISPTQGETSNLASLAQFDLTAGGDSIGIAKDDGSRQWTNIGEILNETTLVIDEGLTSSVASGSTVFTFAELIDRPLRIYNSRRRENVTAPDPETGASADTEIPLSDWSRQEYMDQTLKTTQGTVNNIYYNPQLTNGRLYVWQTASSVNTILLFDYDKPFEVTPDTASEPDIPVEWANPLKWNIAAEMVVAYGVPPDRAQVIKENAFTTLEQAKGNSNQSVYDLLVSPDIYMST